MFSLHPQTFFCECLVFVFVQNVSDVLLYAESKMTRKQAVSEIADVVLRANMKPRTVKHALQLLKALLPPGNTLPTTVNELFGAMLSCKLDVEIKFFTARRSHFHSSGKWLAFSTILNQTQAAASISVGIICRVITSCMEWLLQFSYVVNGCKFIVSTSQSVTEYTNAIISFILTTQQQQQQ